MSRISKGNMRILKKKRLTWFLPKQALHFKIPNFIRIDCPRISAKLWKELQSDTSIVTLPAGQSISTIILNREDYLEKCMDHINNGPYQLLKKYPTSKIETKTLKQLMALKDNEFIDNKLYYYLKPTDSPAPRFYGQPKTHKPGLSIRPIVSYNGSSL